MAVNITKGLSWWEHTLPFSKYSYSKTKPESYHQFTGHTGTEEPLNDSAGMQASQSRLWETAGTRNSFFDK